MNLPAFFAFIILALLILSIIGLLAVNGITSARRKDEENKAVTAELTSLDEAKKERRKCLN